MINKIAESIFYPNFKKQQKIGAEIEFFLINKNTQRRLFIERDRQLFQDFFNFLVDNEGFEKSKDPKTIRFCKEDFGTISFEPGSQIEFASNPFNSSESLTESIQAFFLLFYCFKKQSNYTELDLFRNGYYTGGLPIEDIPILQNKRYSIMNAYFKQFGDFADNMMKCTCALQIHFDFSSPTDLVDKVNRMLLAKPILLYLSSNSTCKKEKCYSFRDTIWEGGDPTRTGTPAGEEIYEQGTWSLESYIEKIVGSPRIFEPNPDYDDLKNLDYHISTIFTDIRVRNTIELRYLDCPEEDLLFPLIHFTYGLIYNNSLWEKFESILPYSFSEIPEICKEINHGTERASVLWKDVIAAPLIKLLNDYGQKESTDFSTIIRKIKAYEPLIYGGEVRV